MQYLISVLDTTDEEARRTSSANQAEMAAIDVFNDQLKTDGHWVFAGGLTAPSTATVVDNRGAVATFTDGPFLESKEYLAGFWIIQAADLDVALKLATEASRACDRRIEVRPFHGE